MDVPYERDADIMVCLRGISIATITPEDIAALLLVQAFGGRILPLTCPEMLTIDQITVHFASFSGCPADVPDLTPDAMLNSCSNIHR